MILRKKKLNKELIKVKNDLDKKFFNVVKLEADLTEKNKEMRELQEELENTYKLIDKKKKKIIS